MQVQKTDIVAGPVDDGNVGRSGAERAGEKHRRPLSTTMRSLCAAGPARRRDQKPTKGAKKGAVSLSSVGLRRLTGCRSGRAKMAVSVEERSDVPNGGNVAPSRRRRPKAATGANSQAWQR